MTAPVAWVNGALTPRAEATVSIDDAAVKYGAAVFETMRAHRGRIFRWARHLARLTAGLAAIGVDPPPEARLAAAVEATLRANALTEARVRLSVSAGTLSTPNLAIATAPTVVITADPLSEAAPPPVHLRVASLRVDEARPAPFAKTAQYLVYLLARAEARRAGAGDALLLNHRNEVCEAATANFFALIDGVLVTPPPDAGPVLGVARGVLLELATIAALPAAERPLTLDELATASELCLTNSIIGVHPVSRVDAEDGETIWTAPEGESGVTSSLAIAYALAVDRECGEG